MEYRFDANKGANCVAMHEVNHFVRYQIIKPFLGTGSVGAELGVFKGGFGEFLRLHTSKLFLVDVWNLWEASETCWGKKGESTKQAREAYNNIHQIYKGDPTIKVCREPSIEFLTRQPDNSFDFFYVDSGHDEHPNHIETMDELSLCLQKTAPGKFIIGDDYVSRPTRLHTVLNQFLEKNKLQLITLQHNQWAIRKPLDIRQVIVDYGSMTPKAD